MPGIGEYLSGVKYPGRIVMIGRNKDGMNVLFYAVTARSERSRNRMLVYSDGVLSTVMLSDDDKNVSILSYDAMKTVSGMTVIANGDHTDTVYNAIREGRSLSDAVAERTYEEDGPIYTPRIGGVLGSDGLSLFSIRKDGDGVDRLIYRYPLENGIGHVLHTYDGSADEPKAYQAMPQRITLDDGEDVLESAWNAITPDYRVGAFIMVGDEWRVKNVRMGNGDGEA